MKQNEQKSDDILPLILLVAFAVLSVLHFYWTFYTIDEEIMEGWGSPTSLDIAVLLPFGIEILGLPFFVGEIVFFFLLRNHRPQKSILILNVVFFMTFVLEAIVFNILIYV